MPNKDKQEVKQNRLDRKNKDQQRRDRAFKRDQEAKTRNIITTFRFFLDKIDIISFDESVGFNIGVLVKQTENPIWQRNK